MLRAAEQSLSFAQGPQRDRRDEDRAYPYALGKRRLGAKTHRSYRRLQSRAAWKRHRDGALIVWSTQETLRTVALDPHIRKSTGMTMSIASATARALLTRHAAGHKRISVHVMRRGE
jgi:hypothetical protein